MKKTSKPSKEQQKKYNKTESIRRAAVRSTTTEKGRDATRISRVNLNEMDYLRGRVTFDVTGESEFDCYVLPPQLLCEQTRVARKRRLGAHAETPGFNQYTDFSPGAIILASNGVFATDKNDEISHLCGNWKCARFAHLVWENHAKNIARVGCPGEINCRHHEWCNACIHTPKCKKRTTITE